MLRSFVFLLLLGISSLVAAASVTREFDCTDVPSFPKKILIVFDKTSQGDVATTYLDGVLDDVTTETSDSWVSEGKMLGYIMKKPKKLYPTALNRKTVNRFTGWMLDPITIMTKPVKLPISGTITLTLREKKGSLRRYSMKIDVQQVNGIPSAIPIDETRFTIDQKEMTIELSIPTAGWTCRMKAKLNN